jgi:hypothetical protein
MNRIQLIVSAILGVIALVAAFFIGRSAGFERGYRTAKQDYGIEQDSFAKFDASNLVIPAPEATK